MRNLLATTAFALALTCSSANVYAYEGYDDKEGIYGEYISSRLSPDEADNFREQMHDAYVENESYTPEIRKLHHDLHRILTAPKFNSDAFITKSNELRDIHEKMGANWTTAFTSAVENLPQSERMKISESMGAKSHKPEHHWFGR